MPVEIDGQKFYRPAEVCMMAGVSRSTLHRWIREGVIPDTEYKDRNGWRLFAKKEVNTIKAEANKTNRI
ncbi:helix-turn-helix domain-containing protein [Chloroflexota bacterium]